MPSVNIVKAFTLTHDKTTQDDPNMIGKEQYFAPGVHEMPDALANHWFVAAHSDNPPAAPPRPGTPEYGAAQAAAARRRMLVTAAIEQEAEDAKAAIRKEAHLSGRYGQVEAEAHAEAEAEEAKAADEEAINEAARTGRKVALPSRRAVVPPSDPPAS